MKIKNENNVRRMPSKKQKAPVCPYTRLPCEFFNPNLGVAVCQARANQYSKGSRCYHLPSWVPSSRCVAVMHGGVLHV